MQPEQGVFRLSTAFKHTASLSSKLDVTKWTQYVRCNKLEIELSSLLQAPSSHTQQLGCPLRYSAPLMILRSAITVLLSLFPLCLSTVL